MAVLGATIELLGNGMLDIDLAGFSPNVDAMCGYKQSIKYNKRTGGAVVQGIIDQDHQLEMCAYTDAPIAGVVPIYTINGVEITTQTLLYNTLKNL